MSRSEQKRFPCLGDLRNGSVEHHFVRLPGPELAGENWPVITVSGTDSGPALLVTAGVHGSEYPAIESAIRLGKLVDPEQLNGTLIILPVVNLPAFRERSMFVCPVDDKNPNRTFPGDPNGTYSEQLAHAITTEFIVHADCYIDLHGGDMVEALMPFSICRRGDEPVDQQSRELALAFGLENLLLIDKPVQQSSGDMTFVASAERGVPAFIAEAGGNGQLDEPSVRLLLDGIFRVMNHLGMTHLDVPPPVPPNEFHEFQWLYSCHAGMFYTDVTVGEQVKSGQVIGRIGSFHGEDLEQVVSPVDGRVLFLTTSPAVKQEGLLMGIGIKA